MYFSTVSHIDPHAPVGTCAAQNWLFEQVNAPLATHPGQVQVFFPAYNICFHWYLSDTATIRNTKNTCVK